MDTVRRRLINGINPQWRRGRRKYDPSHWEKLFSTMVAAQPNNELYKIFCASVSDALFQILPGERARVLEHLVQLGMTRQQIRRLRR